VIDPQANYERISSQTNGPDRGIDSFFPQDLQGLLLKQEARVREFVRAHPLGVVLSALVFGYIAARVMRED
jgi:hypothetical protein